MFVFEILPQLPLPPFTNAPVYREHNSQTREGIGEKPPLAWIFEEE